MSLVESHWKDLQCRYEDGLYFPSDEFIELCGSPQTGYRADLRAPVSGLVHAFREGWTQLETRCSTEGGHFKILAGATAWEGAGFIAALHQDTGRLVWLLLLSNSEPFTEVTCDGFTIHAVSEEYSFRCRWQIPIESPEELVVAQTRVH